jgi:regulator of sigma E protease
MIITSILILCVLIFVHELGHFLVAKWNNVGVLAFSIGFGPVLWKKQVGETTYTLRLLPLGGFVRMVGDDPRASDPNFKVEESEDKASPENLKAEEFTPEQRAMMEDRARWFMLKGFWSKFWIVFAGPAFNFIFAIVLGSMMVGIYGSGKPITAPQIGDVVPGHAADKAGLKPDDMVLMINGAPIESWESLAKTIRGSGGKNVEMLVERQGEKGIEKITLTVVPEVDRSGLVTDEERKTGDVYRIGITPAIERIPASFSEALLAGPRITWHLTTQTVIGLKGLILGHISSDNIAGPIRIFEEAGKSAKRGFEYVLSFMIFLNVSLAVLNLLPVPVLDGGHIIFFIIEAIKGGPISIKVREVATQIGMFLLLALMIFALGNDLFRS